MLCSVIAKNRTLLMDDRITLREAKRRVESLGLRFSIRRLLQFYGLRYVEDRSFISRYRQEFNLSESKSIYDIKLYELRAYRDSRIGHTVDWAR